MSPAKATTWNGSITGVASGSCSAWGRNEKIPPPSLSTTTMVRSTGRWASATSDDESWRKATSPMSNVVGEPVRATPTAVAIVPSIPLAPRLA